LLTSESEDEGVEYVRSRTDSILSDLTAVGTGVREEELVKEMELDLIDFEDENRAVEMELLRQMSELSELEDD